MRWLILDEVVSIERQSIARAKSHVPDSEFGSELLMIEMMAQTGALLIGAEMDFKEDLVFAKVDEAQFDRGFESGETLEIEARCENIRPEGSWVEARIQNARGNAARARLLLANVGHLVPGQSEPISFHSSFMKHFKIKDKVK
jgi:hypothetical protein